MATTWNPSDKDSDVTLSAENMRATATAGAWNSVRATEYKNSGAHYCEVKAYKNGGGYCMVGMMTIAAGLGNYPGADSYGFAYSYSGYVYAFGGEVPPQVTGYGNSEDNIGMAYDAVGGTLSFYLNNVLKKTITGITAGTALFPAVSVQQGAYCTGLFASTDFVHTPPSGYSAWDADAVTTVAIDTLRQTTTNATANIDTLRQLSGPASVTIDTLRRLAGSQEFTIDTLRRLTADESVSIDTLRQLLTTVSVPADTSRRRTIPFGFNPAISPRGVVVTTDTIRRLE